jgi:hypothetical protein
VAKKVERCPDELHVETWEERDRLHIALWDEDEILFEWWDDEAQEMFEDGFFKRGRDLAESVIDYAYEMKLVIEPSDCEEDGEEEDEEEDDE